MEQTNEHIHSTDGGTMVMRGDYHSVISDIIDPEI